MFDYTTSKNIIKYFYLLDPDALLKRIITKLNEKNFDFSNHFPQEIFPIIYHEITEYCTSYTDFIISPNSFNSPEGFDATSSAWRILINNVLQNHCILNGFLTSLQTENHKSAIRISGKNDLQLRTGYFKTNRFSDKPKILPNGEHQFLDISQRYNQHKKYWNHQKTSTYTYQYLNKYSSLVENNFIHISKHNGNWGCFIYTNPVVRIVNDNIVYSSNRILTNYNKLYEECLFWIKENDLSPEDRFLFEHAMESMYGFSFFSHVVKLLGKIHSASYDGSETTLKDLEGSVLLNYIQKIAQLPITYNRSVFLEYVIHKIISSRYLNSHDYTPSKPSLFSNISSIRASKEQLITSGLGLTGNYLQKLKYVAIPLLEDMWNVTINDLNEEYLKEKGCPITVQTYQTYIKENYFTITQDYSYYFDNSKLHNLTAESLSLPDINDIPHLYQKTNKNDVYIFHDKAVQESFSKLLFDYFKIERFSQSKIVDLLLPYIQPTIKFDKISSYTNELNFHKVHSQNILSFTETIPSSS